MLWFGYLIALSAAILVPAAAQQRPPAGQPGPWNNDIILFHVPRDGPGAERGSSRIERLAVFPRAGVSTIARLADGRLIAAHQHFPEGNDADFDKVAVRFSEDDGRTWTDAAVITVAGLPAGMRFPFDPTLVVLPDARIRLYFTSRRLGQADLPAIYSAISTDGRHYTFEPGVRFGLDGRPVIDCAVVVHRGIFHLFAPDNGLALPAGPGVPMVGRGPEGAGYHATSRDGLLFTREPDVHLSGPEGDRRGSAQGPSPGRHWLGAAYSDGQSMTFFGTGAGIWMATSSDGLDWRFIGSLPVMGADPGVVRARDGGWIVTATGPPRRVPIFARR